MLSAQTIPRFAAFYIRNALATDLKLPGDLSAGQPRQKAANQNHIGIRQFGVPSKLAPLRHHSNSFRRRTTKQPTVTHCIGLALFAPGLIRIPPRMVHMESRQVEYLAAVGAAFHSPRSSCCIFTGSKSKIWP